MALQVYVKGVLSFINYYKIKLLNTRIIPYERFDSSNNNASFNSRSDNLSPSS